MTGPEVTTELSRLSSENARLRDELEIALRERIDGESNYFDKIINALSNWKIVVAVEMQIPEGKTESREIDLLVFCGIVSPHLIGPKNTRELSRIVGEAVVNSPFVAKQEPVSYGQLEGLLTDLAILGILEKELKSYQSGFSINFWQLSEKGRNVLSRLRLDEMLDSEEDSEEKNND